MPAFWLIMVFVLVPSAVQAQTATVEGVRAVARGNYALAAQILQPLAADEREPDAVAAFFMASLYQSGHGVARDPVRACGLYLRAATAASPLRAQADTLAKTVHHDDPAIMRLCTAAGAGPSRNPSAALPLPPLTQQAGADAAVDAFVRGDSGRAAEILKPLAESWPSRDHVAEFLLATLYETGAGVVADTTRACALYARASSDVAGPFGLQAVELQYAMRASQAAKALRECNLLASIGFDHGFQPVTFELESGHWIALDLEGATISYRGKERRIERSYATPGTLFLPIEHVELTPGAAEPARRHFIELFRWVPAGERTWTLLWHVFEVVRDDLVPVTTQELATVVAERSSLAAAADVHALARLSIDDSGSPQWAVLGGVSPRTGQIESDSDRRAKAEQVRARAAADAQVDWTAVRDLHRAPQLTYSDADGCGGIFVYGWSADRAEAITIRADKDVLGLSTTPRTFQLTSVSSTLQVAVHMFGGARRSWPFCTDVFDPSLEKEAWAAVAGTVTIELSPTGTDARMPSTYRATIRIVGAEFLSTAGVRIRQPQPITLSALVGRVIG